jgi:hypothetical protein
LEGKKPFIGYLFDLLNHQFDWWSQLCYAGKVVNFDIFSALELGEDPVFAGLR